LSFESLNLDARLLSAIASCKYTEPTDIQREAIPVALEGRDLMASAQTGTGKTAAFVLPALQRLLEPSQGRGRGPRVLVLTPTRELATQVTDNVRQFSKQVRVSSGVVVGGMPYPPQIKLLSQPLDILVATPGRLMDHMTSGRVDFSRIEVLVLDEADRMLDMGFVDDIKMIAQKLPKEHITWLFSATFEGKVTDIAQQLLKDPQRIALSSNQVSHASITQRVHDADDVQHKHALLAHIIENESPYQAVVFTATKRGAELLANNLTNQGHSTAALHGDMPQNARRRTIDRMRRGDTRILVATDVAARGLDIKGLSHVINFDLPMVAEDYIHRIGRTGRGGATGIAISLVGPQDRGLLRGIERLTGKRLERAVVAGLEPKRPAFEERRPGPHKGRRPSQGHGQSQGQGARSASGNGGYNGNSFNANGFKPRGEGPRQRTADGKPRQGNGSRPAAGQGNGKPRANASNGNGRRERAWFA
jgi:superfamily II DNA/RNA helicase